MTYLWSPHAKVYHNGDRVKEACNTDQLARRKTSDTPPPGKRPCEHCIGESAYSESNAGFTEQPS